MGLPFERAPGKVDGWQCASDRLSVRDLDLEIDAGECASFKPSSPACWPGSENLQCAPAGDASSPISVGARLRRYSRRTSWFVQKTCPWLCDFKLVKTKVVRLGRDVRWCSRLEFNLARCVDQGPYILGCAAREPASSVAFKWVTGSMACNMPFAMRPGCGAEKMDIPLHRFGALASGIKLARRSNAAVSGAVFTRGCGSVARKRNMRPG
jgi:hypothetical protein